MIRIITKVIEQLEIIRSAHFQSIISTVDQVSSREIL